VAARVPDEVTSRTVSGEPGQAGSPAMTGPLWRAAPTRLAVPGIRAARSRRWLIVGGVAVAALLAGASVALAATGSGPPTPVHAARASTPAHSAAQSDGLGRRIPVTG
jgi:hypothetical protein